MMLPALRGRVATLLNGGVDGKALMLLAASILGQGITVLVSPLLTRLYTPIEYGVLGSFTAIALICSTLSSLRYEMAFTMVRRDSEAYQLLKLCALTIFLTTLLAAVCLYLLRPWFSGSADWLQTLWPFVPVGLVSIAAYNVLVGEASRRRRYGDVAMTKVWQGVGSASMQVGLGILGYGAGGLLVGFIVGQSAGIMLLLRRLVWGHPGRTAAVDTLKSVAYTYRSLPRYSSWTGVLDAAGTGYLMTLLLASTYGVAMVGYVFLAERVVGRPLLMTANSLLTVYIGEATHLRNSEPAKLPRLFRSVLLRQAAISLLWTGAVAIAAPVVVGPLFGPSWTPAVPVIQAIAFAIIPQSILQAAVHTLQMFGQQPWAALWALGRVLGIVASFFAVYALDAGAVTAIVAYAAVQWLAHLVLYLKMRATVLHVSGMTVSLQPNA